MTEGFSWLYCILACMIDFHAYGRGSCPKAGTWGWSPKLLYLTPTVGKTEISIPKIVPNMYMNYTFILGIKPHWIQWVATHRIVLESPFPFLGRKSVFSWIWICLMQLWSNSLFVLLLTVLKLPLRLTLCIHTIQGASVTEHTGTSE